MLLEKREQLAAAKLTAYENPTGPVDTMVSGISAYGTELRV